MSITPIEEDIRFMRKTISDLNEEIEHLTMLQNLGRQIIFKFDFNQIVNIFLDIVKEFVNYHSCILYLYQEDSNSYRIEGFRGLSEKDLKNYQPDDEIIDWVLNEGRWTHIHLSFLQGANPKDNESVSILPLQGSQRDLGFLLMSSDPEENVFTQANMKRLSFIASQIGIALENQDLYSKLNHSREYIKNILESINNGIITIDMTDRITQINKNATALLGLPSADIIGFNYKKAFAKDLVKMIDKVKLGALKDGFAFETLFDYFPAKDFKIPLGINSSVLFGEQGNRMGIIVVFSNMLALKELERLRQLDEMKSEFVSNVSHELRSPLSVIKSYVETLVDQVDPNDHQTRKQFLMVINNETDRLTALVGDLLDISRIESGKFEIELGPVALSDIIHSVSKDLENKCKRHQIVIGIPSRLPPLLADEDKMVQVFLNLLDNAIKFSPEGGKIFVNAVVEEKMLKCDITDQGIGIDEENISQVFKKFYRVDNSDLYEIAGTGLGLPIVKHIIESLGGEIKVKSALGKGSTFTLWLPLVSD